MYVSAIANYNSLQKTLPVYLPMTNFFYTHHAQWFGIGLHSYF